MSEHVNTTYLRSLHPLLVSSEPDMNVQLEQFQGETAFAIKNFEKSLIEASKVDSGYKPEIRMQKQSEIIAPAYDKLIEKTGALSQKIVEEKNSVEKNIESALHRPELANDSEREIALAQDQEIRNVLRGLSREDRAKRLMDSVAKKDRRVLNALDPVIDGVDFINPTIVNNARQNYLQVARPDLLRDLEKTSARAETAKLTAQTVSPAVQRLGKKTGVDVDMLLKYRTEAKRQALRDRPTSDKVKDVNENGFQGFQNKYE